MGFKRKADPAEVEEIEDEEEARLGSQFLNHPRMGVSENRGTPKSSNHPF